MSALATYRDAIDALLMSGQWRTVGLDFLDHVHTARELGRWLIGPYRDAASHVPRLSWTCSDAPAFDVAAVDTIVERARADVFAALEEARWGNGPAFVKEAIESDAIVPTVEGFWIPLDLPRMRLRDRVLALFAADYLLRPRDYARAFAICATCQRVVFDPAARHTRRCGAHRISGFLRKIDGRISA
jgi:hypothetical protein